MKYNPLIAKYFRPEELVSKEDFIDSLKKGIDVYTLFDPDAIQLLIDLHEFFGFVMRINNWFWGGDFNWRGFRSSECKVGAKYSAHKLGMAFDIDFINGKSGIIPASVMINAIVTHRDKFKMLRGIETGVNWVHVDVMVRKAGGLVKFDAKGGFEIV
jgi:hypothetical protein